MTQETLPFIDPVKLDSLARVSILVGLQIKPKQDLIITAPIGALPLVRRITHHAYKEGAGIVTCFFTDEDMTLSRFLYAKEDSFDHAPNWLYEGMAKAFTQGTARLAITGGDPMLLANQDPEKIARSSKAHSVAYKPALEKISRFDINWTIIAYPDPAWASLVFPDENKKVATEKLAHAIFTASRVNDTDPISEWKQHNATLHKRANWLNENNFHSLHFTGPGTDLIVGLADNHSWKAGATKARNNIVCNPNIPTEEVFTTPHAYRVEGFVRSTKPLSCRGTLIHDIEVRFEAGKIVEAKASRGETILQSILNTDEGARRLGEVALVPHSSPISAQGLLFYNTLFDENAASHIALGQCYHECFRSGDSIDENEVSKCGGNKSLIHIDWMIGSSQINVDGITQDKNSIPVMRNGEWANKV